MPAEFVAPVELEEDGQYVLVDDKRAVEINRAVDGAFLFLVKLDMR